MSNNPHSNRIVWIDAIKLVACLAIFWAHYLCVFLLCTKCITEAPTIYCIGKSNIVTQLLDSNMWLCIFFALSGFVIERKRITSLKQLMVELLLRYLYFAFFTLFVSCIVFILSKTVSFPTMQYSYILGNSWLRDFYNTEFSVIDILRSSFLFWNGMIPPIWMLKSILVGNALLLIVNWLAHALPLSSKSVILIIISFFFRRYVSIENGYFILFCIWGSIISSLLFSVPEIMTKPKIFSKKPLN